MEERRSLWAHFAETAERIASTSKRLEKIAFLRAYLPDLPLEDLPLAARFFAARAFPLHDQRKLNVGAAQVRDALDLLYHVEFAMVRALPKRFGDMGDVTEAVLERREAQPDATVTLQQVATLLEKLAETRGSKSKTVLLSKVLEAMDALEGKYLVKLLLGEMRIGLREGLMEEALARIFGQPLEQVQRANMLTGDLGATALRAKEGTLAEATMELFHPLTFMLASPIEGAEALAAAFDPPYYVEDKYDGIRAQLHKDQNGRLALFTRTLDEVLHRFPELEEAAQCIPGEWILDGEIVARRDGRYLPFKELQQRLGRKRVTANLLESVPVIFVAFDLLYHDGTLWLEQPLSERRKVLEAIPILGGIRRSDLLLLYDPKQVIQQFEPARARGAEGLMIKNPSSIYRPGRRGKEWLKVKRPLATLDVVVTAVEWGHGKRRDVLSDYTFAVRRSEEDDTLLNIGKAYSGLTDREILRLTEWFMAHTIQTFGRTRLVQPQIVLEVAFDVVQPSKRHKSGYALRFPRIVRIREDKKVDEIDTLQAVVELAGDTNG